MGNETSVPLSPISVEEYNLILGPDEKENLEERQKIFEQCFKGKHVRWIGFVDDITPDYFLITCGKKRFLVGIPASLRSSKPIQSVI